MSRDHDAACALGSPLPGGGGWLDITKPKKPVIVKSERRAGGCTACNTRLKELALDELGLGADHEFPTPVPARAVRRGERARNLVCKGFRGIRPSDIMDPTKARLFQQYSAGSTGKGAHA